MATIQVRNVPASAHRALRIRAAAAGQSLQEYLRDQLIELARTRDLAEVVAEARAEATADPTGFSDVSATTIIRRERDAR